MRRILTFLLTGILLGAVLLYFEVPFTFLRPVFHADIIKRYAAQYDVDPLLVTALIKVESKFFRRARSHRGAVGLTQLMPATARDMALELGYRSFRSVDLEDPETNIRLGTYYLHKLRNEFDGNDILALAAYNAGRTNVRTWCRHNPLIGFEPEEIPYPETRRYVASVLRTYEWLKKIQKIKNLIRPRKG